MERKYEPEPIRIPTPPPKTPPKTRTVGTQSIYRESETQTVPYSPDYIIKDESKVFHSFNTRKIFIETFQ